MDVQQERASRRRNNRAVMSTRLRSVPRALVLTAALGGLSAAVLVTAGAKLGLSGLVLCPLAAAGVLAWQRAFDRREAGLLHLAHIDPLTGLGNHRLLRSRLSYEIAR